MVPVIDRNRCEGKAACVSVCPTNVFVVAVLPAEERRGLTLMGRLKGFGTAGSSLHAECRGLRRLRQVRRGLSGKCNRVGERGDVDMMTTELWRRCAHELAAMIRSKEVSSREVVQSHLDRIAAVNGKVNAITVTLAESALQAADRADATTPTGPLHGVPFTIKENIDCTGSATTQGLPALAGSDARRGRARGREDEAAGAIPLARTNLPEMGLRITTDNPLRGRTSNPWNPARTAGGSSGGEGAALATGMSPIGLGNDIGGSLRNPAYCCGIAALKSTIGRIPMVLSIPAVAQPISFRMMCVEGPMARSVADLKIAYRLLAGWHPGDPFGTRRAGGSGCAQEGRDRHADAVFDLAGIHVGDPQGRRRARGRGL